MSLYDESDYDREIRRKQYKNYCSNQIDEAEAELEKFFTKEQAEAIINYIKAKEEYFRSLK